MAAKSTSNPTSPIETAPSIISATDLIQRRGTIPFLGLTDAVGATYPDAVSTHGRRFATDEANAMSYKNALEILPNAEKGDLWADNEFVEPESDGSVSVDLDALRDVHGLDIDELETKSGFDLSTIVEQADPEPLIPVTTDRDIIDRRRLALRTLGFDVEFRWQIASNRYEPGDMRAFFRRKIAACQKHGCEDVFGWIRHYDWGGSVQITTIYPSKAYEIQADDTDIDLDADSITVAGDVGEDITEGDLEDAESLTIYYGDQMGYDFRGRQKLWVNPVVFVPKVGAMIPLPYDETDLSRKHTGSITEDAIQWHEKILSKIDEFTTTVNNEIKRALLVALDFEELPFTVEEFYEYIGVSNDDCVEAAADQATALASPSTQPTLWNLQLSLKLALIDHYEGNKAGQTYREYTELAGEILRHPATMISMAKEQHRIAKQKEDDADEPELDAAQTTLAETLDDVLDLTGVTENQLDATDAQHIEQRVQTHLGDIGGEA